MPKFVYLAGGITGLTWKEANEWRGHVRSKLGSNIVGVSPLRTEPMVGDTYDPIAQANDLKYGAPRAITAKNKLDVRSCDVVLAYLPEPSTGTFIELGWADAYNKPIIVVSKNPKVINHAVVVGVAPWILPTLDDAVELIRGTFDVYAQPEELRRAA